MITPTPRSRLADVYDEHSADNVKLESDPGSPGLFRAPGYTDPYGVTLPPPPPTVAWVQISPSGKRQSLHFVKPKYVPEGWTMHPLTYLIES